ncbi:HAD family hydrolase [Embleya sp. NBC_00896]|uniref:HAD family hydrolase n=1 Tax=Embleya sp. NBC_00896 TaxID=2975961 RepID=UPI003863B2ED|nr:HAD family hydrolase [Embleya sp. NBC_00896]
MKPDLVLFDNDGVLVDSEPIANRALAALLTELGVPTTYEDSLRDYLGGTMARVHAIVRERDGVTLPDDFDHVYHERVFAGFRAELEAVVGVAEVLDALDLAGVPYCLASSGTHERIRLALNRTDLIGRFPEPLIFSSQDVAQGKPAPDLFLHAAATMGVDPARCVVVEDSPLGVRAARAAGMTVYGYAAMTPPERLADADSLFKDMVDLPELLGIRP